MEELSKHVEFYSKNKLEKSVQLVGFIIRIYHDAWSPERQIRLLGHYTLILMVQSNVLLPSSGCLYYLNSQTFLFPQYVLKYNTLHFGGRLSPGLHAHFF